MKPFKAWLLVDRQGTYSPTMHITRREAKLYRDDGPRLIDATWVIVRVIVRRVDRSNKVG